MKIAIVAAALATLACLPATAQPSAPSSAQRPCLRLDSIYNWKAVDNKTLIVEDDFHKKFRVGLMAYCEGLQFKERVGFRSAVPVQLTCLTAGDDVIIRQLGTGFARCPISSITPDAASAAAPANTP